MKYNDMSEKEKKEFDFVTGNVMVEDMIKNIEKFNEPLDVIASKVMAKNLLDMRHRVQNLSSLLKNVLEYTHHAAYCKSFLFDYSEGFKVRKPCSCGLDELRENLKEIGIE